MSVLKKKLKYTYMENCTKYYSKKIIVREKTLIISKVVKFFFSFFFELLQGFKKKSFWSGFAVKFK